MKTVTELAQQIADQELEACVEWMKIHLHSGSITARKLCAARRPKPPSLAARALHILGSNGDLSPAEHSKIRRALEQLND